MRTPLRFLRRIALLSPALVPLIASAHPGHDDPDFTWEYSHLVAHPAATLICFGAIVGAAAIAWFLVRRSQRPSL